MEENRIVQLAQKGDDAALELILTRYKDLVRSRARAYFIMGAETEDTYSGGNVRAVQGGAGL